MRLARFQRTLKKKGIANIKVHISNLHFCISAFQWILAKFYMINMAFLCFLSCNFGTDWLKNEENTARPI